MGSVGTVCLDMCICNHFAAPLALVSVLDSVRVRVPAEHRDLNVLLSTYVSTSLHTVNCLLVWSLNTGTRLVWYGHRTSVSVNLSHVQVVISTQKHAHTVLYSVNSQFKHNSSHVGTVRCVYLGMRICEHCAVDTQRGILEIVNENGN